MLFEYFDNHSLLKKPKKNKKSAKQESKTEAELPLQEKTKPEVPMEEDDEYDELVQDLTSWLDSFIDIDLSLPPFNFMVFITCLIGQLLVGFPCSLIKRIASALPQAVIEEP